MMQHMALTLSWEIDASCIVGRRDLLMKYNHKWALGVRQVGANVLMSFQDVFHLDSSLAINFKVSSVSACVGDSILLFPLSL